MKLDHTIIPVKDREASAKFFARVMGVDFIGANESQGFVRVNDALILRFDDRPRDREHYAFRVSDEEFDSILGRVTAEGLTYGKSPREQDNQVDLREGGRRVFFNDPDGHSIELLTGTAS